VVQKNTYSAEDRKLTLDAYQISRILPPLCVLIFLMWFKKTPPLPKAGKHKSLMIQSKKGEPYKTYKHT